MKTRSQAVAARLNLLSLPPEIFAILEAYLELRELATFVLTCKSIKQHIERFLYKKVFISRRSSTTNTKFFVSLLKHRPELIPWIHKFVIDEYDVEHFPQLLSLTFPNLENLIIQHDGSVKLPPLGKRKRNALNVAVKPQPSLLNLTFSIEQVPGAPVGSQAAYPLPASAATFFCHPKLMRMRLSYVDLSVFKSFPEDHFEHPHLGELFLERCSYSAYNLRQLTNTSASLAKLCLYQDHVLPFPEDKLPAILGPCKSTLRVLDLVWGQLPPLSDIGMDFRSFVNLHSIRVHPQLLFGTRYRNLSNGELSDLITSRLPPDLMILALECIVPIGRGRYEDTVPQDRFRVPPGAAPDRPIPPADLELIRHVLKHQPSIVPKLEWLVVYYLEHMEALPEDIICLAKERDIKCCGFYERDEIAPPLDMRWHVRGKDWTEGEEREGGDGFCTFLDHSGSTVPWPNKSLGNY